MQKVLDAFAPRRARLCTASCLLVELKSIGWRPRHAICARKLRDPAKPHQNALVQIHSLTLFGCFRLFREMDRYHKMDGETLVDFPTV